MKRCLGWAFLIGFVVGLSPRQLAYGEIAMAPGIAVIDEGDDRAHPGVGFLVKSAGYNGHLYYTGQSFGPVLQRKWLLSGSKTYPLPQWPVSAYLGFALLVTKIDIQTLNDPAHDYRMDETHLNAGFDLGFRYAFFSKGPLVLDVSWESALFPAGINGGLLLSTGRLQVVSLHLGVLL